MKNVSKTESKVPAEAYSNKQLTLFQTFLANTGDQREALSNAIDIWDSIPRYAVTRMRMNSLRTSAGFLDTIEIPFNYRGRALTAVIHPARIEREEGDRVSFYPSAREELVEHALRKIAAQHNAGFHDSKTLRSGVKFSLHQLRKELEVQGHSLRYDEIVEALDILSLSAVEILATNEQGDKAFARSNYLSALTGVKRKSYEDDRASRWSAQFHPLVTQAIDQVAYRQFNYQRLMQCRSQLARWLLSQLVLKYTQAATANTFEMRFSTVRRDSALLEGYGRDRDAIRGSRTFRANWCALLAKLLTRQLLRKSLLPRRAYFSCRLVRSNVQPRLRGPSAEDDRDLLGSSRKLSNRIIRPLALRGRSGAVRAHQRTSRPRIASCPES